MIYNQMVTWTAFAILAMFLQVIDDQSAIAAKMMEMPSPLKNAIMRADLEDGLKCLQDAGVPEASQMAIEDCPTCLRPESEKGKTW